MEKYSDPSEISQPASKRKGGFITLPFILANETFEKVASFGLQANMIVYLTKYYNLSVVSAASILYIWNATSSFVPIFGAFLSDSYLGRFKTIASGSIASLLGMFLMWLTAAIPQARPPRCNPSENSSCKLPSARQMTHLLLSFILMSIGAGGVRPCSLAFGTDQLNKSSSKKEKNLQSYFSWYYISICLATVVSVTGIVYVQEHVGWNLGLLIPVIVMFVATAFFFLGSPLFVKRKPDPSIFTGLAMVIVAALRKRRHALPPKNTASWYYHKGSNFISPTDKLRCLNKACMIKDPEKDLNSDGSPSNPWSLCTVDQVESLKALIRLFPICSTGTVIAFTSSQQSILVLQASTMNRHLGQSFQIPGASFSMFQVVALTIWVAIYDRIIVPTVYKLTGKQQALTAKQRMGIGLFLSFGNAAISATVERYRRKMAIQHGLRENAQGVLAMSAMWLVPQLSVSGFAEGLNAIAQTEFYYSQLPKSMSSLVMAIFTLPIAIGSLLGSLLIQIVDKISKRGGRDSWVDNNLNKGHYDYYYWILAVLNLINCGYFILCAWAYGSVQEGTRAMEEKHEEDIDEAKPKESEINNNV